jgi:hypothetical protein
MSIVKRHLAEHEERLALIVENFTPSATEPQKPRRRRIPFSTTR